MFRKYGESITTPVIVEPEIDQDLIDTVIVCDGEEKDDITEESAHDEQT